MVLSIGLPRNRSCPDISQDRHKALRHGMSLVNPKSYGWMTRTSRPSTTPTCPVTLRSWKLGHGSRIPLSSEMSKADIPRNLILQMSMNMWAKSIFVTGKLETNREGGKSLGYYGNQLCAINIYI